MTKTETVKIITILGDMEITRKELREKTKPILKKINRNGTKVWETKIGKLLKIISINVRLMGEKNK